MAVQILRFQASIGHADPGGFIAMYRMNLVDSFERWSMMYLEGFEKCEWLMDVRMITFVYPATTFTAVVTGVL